MRIFRLEEHSLSAGSSLKEITKQRFAIITVVAGELKTEDQIFTEGEFFIIPHAAAIDNLQAASDAKVLLTTWGA